MLISPHHGWQMEEQSPAETASPSLPARRPGQRHFRCHASEPIGRIEVEFAITKKSVRCLVAVLFCQGLALLLLSLPMEAQSNGGGKTKDFAFEVVSIRESSPVYGGPGLTPNGFRAVMSIEYLIKLGYGQGQASPHGDRMSVINLPNWSEQTYQIDARVAEQDLNAWKNQSRNYELLRSAIRQILKERFHLVLHERQVQRDGYQLVVRRQGVKFKPTPAGSVLPAGRPLPDGGINVAVPSSGSSRYPNVRFYGTSMSDLASFLNMYSSRPIYDETELIGRYDFILQSEEQSEISGEMLFLDLNSIGLELNPGKGPGQDLIIDHVERPTLN